MKPRTRLPTASKPKKAARLRAVRLEPRIAPKIAINHNETVVRELAEAKPEEPAGRTDAQKPMLKVVKLEERIAPRSGGCDEWGCGTNHNETLVREPAEAEPLDPAARKDAHKPKLKVVKLEERIAPRSGACEEWGCGMNHNEALVRDTEKSKPEAAKRKKAARLRVVPLEGRIAPGTSYQHNETLVEDAAKTKTNKAPRLRVVKLEERIAPRSGACEEWGCGTNHNETLVRDRA